MNTIHPTAIVSSKANLGNNIKVGAYTIIEDDVEISDECEIGPHVVIYDGARIGKRVKIKQGASISNKPQDLKFKDEESILIVDEDTDIREYATLHRGTKETGRTKVGKHCLLMAYTHIPHDAIVGDHTILANAVQIGGHTHIGDWVILGGLVGVHQFVQIGDHAMVASSVRISQDVPPYILVSSEPAKYSGLNVVGLKRRGFTTKDIETLKEAYKYLYDKSMNVSQARKIIESEFGDHKYVVNLLQFLEKSKRGIVGK
ncbi:MAG: acyl-ACP--UDP-N-acetylglucosamine O-acyltransferase [Ignavibacteriaceae bacterium]